MKKFATLMLVALVAVAAMFSLVACNKPLEDAEHQYVITGQFASWGDVITADGPKAEFKMTAIGTGDAKVASIKDKLADAKYLYIAEHEFTNNYTMGKDEEGNDVKVWDAGWSFSYALTEGAELTEVDGNMALKVIRTKEESAGGVTAWTAEWLPDAGNTTVISLTPSTLYMPPHSEQETYPNSGAWNSNPMVLTAGTYYVVFAEFADGTYGLGCIAK